MFFYRNLFQNLKLWKRYVQKKYFFDAIGIEQHYIIKKTPYCYKAFDLLISEKLALNLIEE